MHVYKEQPDLTLALDADDFNNEEKKYLFNLFGAFVLLDNDYSDEEKNFIDTLCDKLSFNKDDFSKLVNQISEKKNITEFCIKQILDLRDVTVEKKQIILDILFELSYADKFLHINEKEILDTISSYWGLKAIFAKGDLQWTEEQKNLIYADSKKRLLINAAPGSGKTALACARISNIIDKGVEPNNIWLISFTRTAIQELKNRISLFSKSEETILGIKIATIDSRAWQLRYGFRDEDVNKLFQGYDLNISDSIEVMEKNSEAFEEYFSEIEHLIIDEAQDITGPRLTFIKKIIEYIPKSCGITILGDKSQAIYGFSNDEDNIQEDNNIHLINYIEEKKKDIFEFKELKSIHRTNDKDLLNIIEDVRIDSDISPNSLRNKLQSTKSMQNSISEQDYDTLILFRKRSEVLTHLSLASYYGPESNFRLRLSGLPVVVRPWIATLFLLTDKKKISQEEFEEMLEDWFDMLEIKYDNVKSAFKRLHDVAGFNNLIDLEKIRNLLSRNTPPLELCLQDIGHRGPVLGTIHSSKGRQASNVILNLSKYSDIVDEKSKEETKIIFVGATRAKKNLQVKDAYYHDARNLESGRTFRRLKSKKKFVKRAQVEIGRNKDYLETSIISENSFFYKKDIESIQDFLINNQFKNFDVFADLEDEKPYLYKLYLRDTEKKFPFFIGYLNESVNADLFTLKKQLGLSVKKGLPKHIPYLKMIGVKSVSIKEESIYYDLIIDKYKKVKVWNVPIIVGFPSLSFWS